MERQNCEDDVCIVAKPDVLTMGVAPDQSYRKKSKGVNIPFPSEASSSNFPSLHWISDPGWLHQV